MRILRTCSSANEPGRRARLLAVILALLLPAAALFSLCVGASGASLLTGVADLLSGVSSPAARIVRYIRMPRVLAAMLAEYEIDEATAAADLDALLEQFQNMGLIEG